MKIRNLKNNDGIALLAIVTMLSGLIGLVAVCAFVVGNEADDDARYDETRERMLEAKRALIGRLADIGGGEHITSCGGFISDYGEPGDSNAFRIDDLLSNSEFAGMPLEYTNFFWAGYRGDRYLEANAKDMAGNDTFIDGWGNSMEVSFHSSAGGDTVLIRSRGQDNILDEGDEADTTYYGKDIEDVFHRRRDIEVENNTGADANFQVIYPFQGTVVGSGFIPISSSSTHTFTGIPIGLRKIEVQVSGNIISIEMVCIPPGVNAYPITVD